MRSSATRINAWTDRAIVVLKPHGGRQRGAVFKERGLARVVLKPPTGDAARAAAPTNVEVVVPMSVGTTAGSVRVVTIELACARSRRNDGRLQPPTRSVAPHRAVPPAPFLTRKQAYRGLRDALWG